MSSLWSKPVQTSAYLINIFRLGHSARITLTQTSPIMLITNCSLTTQIPRSPSKRNLQTHIPLSIMWRFLDINVTSLPVGRADIEADIRRNTSRFRDQQRNIPVFWRPGAGEWWLLTYMDLTLGLFPDLLPPIGIEDSEDAVSGRLSGVVCGLLLGMLDC